MRINLVTPFAEKDAVKALGARWDSAKKTWYITDAADLTPFARWIPDLNAVTDNSAGAATRPTASVQKTPSLQPKGPVTLKPAIDVPHCGCDVLPWEDCPHTAKL